MATLKVNEVTPTSGTTITVGGDLQLGSKNLTTTGNATINQLTASGAASVGGKLELNTNEIDEVTDITGNGTISGFGAVNGTNMTATGVVTAGACTLTATSGAIACTSLAIGGVDVSTSAPLKAFGRISIDTVNATHAVTLQTGSNNIGTPTITAAGVTPVEVTVPFVNAQSNTDFVTIATPSRNDADALPGARQTGDFKLTLTDAKIYDIHLMVLSV